MLLLYLLLNFHITDSSLLADTRDNSSFPSNFIFGAAAAAYQTEGAWNEGGKGENIWDRLVHTRLEVVQDNTTGDVACDFYHKFKEDISLMKELGLELYRFSLSWSRIFPTGLSNQINENGVRFYNNVIDELLANGIQPAITLYHGDLPQPLQDLGGLVNPLIIQYFAEYAQFAFETFGDRVHWWFTFNSPTRFCDAGYEMGQFAPLIRLPGIGSYVCGHNVLKAHARAYHIYHDKYRTTQNGRISIIIGMLWFEPNTTQDAEAANRGIEFEIGRWANPIYSNEGDYPLAMKELIANRSREEGYAKSRLPEFTKSEIQYVKGTYDFFGCNFYTAKLVADVDAEPIGEPSFMKDQRIKPWFDQTWDSSEAPWLKVTPWALRKVLKTIKDKYGNPDIFIAENGFADKEDLNDQRRIRYLGLHLNSILKAIYEDEVRVMGYMVWTLMDNFEWMAGHMTRFGLFHVNFSDPGLPRTPRASANYYKEVISGRKLIPWNSQI